ncbi:hypothetical protein [Catenovulum sp. 2E275]|uniref:hypothetical protein n=1 Tax=Catenovulum sp. 2E275 TaxID=2980497 RepID=UPI0021CF9DE5|nr:hypothetical protein [Catenovulum sp. 2E275]
MIEPICVEHEHANFNKAFLTGISSENNELDIICEFHHFSRIRHGNLKRRKNPFYKKLSNNRGLKVIQELLLTIYAFFWGNFKYDQVIFLSCSKINFLVYGLLSFITTRAKTYFVAHSILSTIESDKKAISLQKVVNLYLRHGNKMIVLGEPIKNNLKGVIWKLQNVISIPHLYEMGSIRKKQSSARLIFAFLGVMSKAKANLEFLSNNCKVLTNENFRIIGYSTQACNRIRFNIPTSPIPADDYERLIVESDYVVSCLDQSRYKYTASGTFFDSLKYSKPGIYLKNDFISYYFNEFGSLGYLCDTMDDIAQIIERIEEDGPDIKFYELCVSNINKARLFFEPRNNNQLLLELVS